MTKKNNAGASLMARIAAGIAADAAEVAAGIEAEPALGQKIEATRKALAELDAKRAAAYLMGGRADRLELEKIEAGRTRGIAQLEALEAQAMQAARQARTFAALAAIGCFE